jgi:competence protein ComEA
VFDPDRRHLIAYLAAATVLVVIGARLLGGGSGSQPVPSISMAAPSPQRPAGARPRANTQGKPLIWVDVAGSVRRPGLYSLPDGARVAAALERAGGVRAKADRAAVNLAAKLTDGQQVFVPSRAAGAAGAAAGAAASAGSASAPSGSAAGASGAAASGGAAGAAGSARISLSNASQAQLEELDGIGPALAQRIIEYRQQHGGFRSIDEVQEVSGIGEKRFEALKASIAP